MADRLAAPRDGGHLLRDLGLIVVLLEFWFGRVRKGRGRRRRRPARKSLSTPVSTSIASTNPTTSSKRPVGSSSNGDYDNGGRNLPSIYTIHEAPLSQGGETELAASGNETSRAADRNGQGGKTELAGRPN